MCWLRFSGTSALKNQFPLYYIFCLLNSSKRKIVFLNLILEKRLSSFPLWSLSFYFCVESSIYFDI